MTHISPNVLGIGTLALATTLAVAGAVWVVAEEIQEVRREVGDQFSVIDRRLDDIGQQQIALGERQAAMAGNIERIERNIEGIERRLDDLPGLIAQELGAATGQ